MRGRRYRNQTGGNRAEIGDGKFDGIAKAHQNDVTGFETGLQEPRSGAAHGGFDLAIAPALGALRGHDEKRWLVGKPPGMGQHMGGHVERGRSGGGCALIEERKHGSLVGPQGCGCKGGRRRYKCLA